MQINKKQQFSLSVIKSKYDSVSGEQLWYLLKLWKKKNDLGTTCLCAEKESPIPIVDGQNRQVYCAKLRGLHTKENVNRGVSVEKPELHSTSKENIAHK